jgi:hypothetical protein
MPRNMKKLKDVLPAKNYEPVVDAKQIETLYSEKPMQKKRSGMEYESKLNYESDANALHPKNESPNKKDARERRAARFRDRSA